MRLSNSQRLITLIVLTALAIALQLSPRPPNVEFTSFIVFLVGAIFGMTFGVSLGFLVMFINGFFSSWGFAGLILPFQMLGMVIVGVGGGLYGKSKHEKYAASSSVETAVLGAFLTLAYDVVTNLGVTVTFMLAGTPILASLLSAFISGALFSAIHIVSNTVVFGLAFFPVTKALQRIIGGEQ